MTDPGRPPPDDPERTFFERPLGPDEGPSEREAVPPRRRASTLLARSPGFAALALAACAWLAWDLWPDAAYFFSSSNPIDLGAPGAYHLDRARENRFSRVQGVAAAQVRATGRRGDERRVLGLFGAPLVVDRPGSGGPANVFEGRILPRRAADDYAPIVEALRERGFPPGGGWRVLRDGERPRTRWSRPLLLLLVLAVGAVNLRALARHLLFPPAAAARGGRA